MVNYHEIFYNIPCKQYKKMSDLRKFNYNSLAVISKKRERNIL
jgi:hypothetical protein